MEVSRIRALRGPNLWTRHTAVEALVRCEGNELDLSNRADFETHLRHLFPGLGQLSPTDRKIPLSMAHAVEATTFTKALPTMAPSAPQSRTCRA